MNQRMHLDVNGQIHELELDPQTLLLYVLRNELGLKGPKYGCGSEQCGACKILVDGAAVPSCQLEVGKAAGLKILTVEGLSSASALHPLPEAFMAEQAIQCGYCASGMIMAAQGLLNRTRYPTDEQIRAALADNICRCGVYERIVRAVKLRIGRPQAETIYEVRRAPSLAAAKEPSVSGDDLPSSLRQNPELDAWIRIDHERTVTVFSGKVEIGQGLKTAVAQIAAEQLDVTLERMRVVTADTELSPDEGLTVGSRSMETAGNAVRIAAAQARQILLALAFEDLESQTPVGQLIVKDGTITDPATGRKTDYWQLFAGRRFGRRIQGAGPLKGVQEYRVSGTPAVRIDLKAKVSGVPSFVHDLQLPGLVYGRVVRPPTYGARLQSIDHEKIKNLPGVLKIIQDGSFLAVIAAAEYQAVQAWETMRTHAQWTAAAEFSTATNFYDHLLNQPAQSHLIKNGTAVLDPLPPMRAPEGSHAVLAATYRRPFQMHASLGPSAAVALLENGRMTIWSHTQGVFILRTAIAQVLAMDPDAIRVIHVEGSGCYGHNGADDAALDAALLARALPGRPVSVNWMRADEHMWEPYGPAMVIKMQAYLDSEGKILSWNHDLWSYPHNRRPRPAGDHSGLLAAWHLEQPWPAAQPPFFMGTHAGSYRNADPLYSFPEKRVIAHMISASPIRTSAMRGLGAYANVFAIESFIDELAMAAAVDPVQFRLGYLSDERARTVIEAAAAQANWQPRTAPAGQGRGRGIAFAQYKNIQCYCAVIVDLTVDLDTGQVQLERAVIAADAGQIINPDGLSNQLEGGFVQSVSWTLLEAVSYDQNGIQSRDWDSYPVLRAAQSAPVKTVLIDRVDAPFLGSGEAAQGPTAAAVANAVFDATAVRMRDLPLTPQKILDALPR